MCRNPDIHPQPNVVRLCEEGLEVYRQALTKGPLRGDVPDCLIELGLLRPLAEEPALVVAVPPDIASSELRRPIERAVLVQQHTIAAIQEALSAAEDIYRDEFRETGQAVRLLRGIDVIQAALRQARDTCVEEVITAKPGGPRVPEGLARALPHNLTMLRKGVKQRTLYQHTVRTHGPTLAYIEQVAAAGAEVRTLNEVFDRLIIYDRRIAFIPEPLLDVNSTAVVIEHPAIVHYLATVFDNAWHRAEPVTMTPQQARPPLMTDETRKAVLRLMIEGHTDAAISKRLGISTRTVSTHIKKASEAFNSRSRAQLAYLLAKSSIIDDEAS
ncbi:LuxR C-terminal-related transcriptional regulator [Streptomyces sp. NPDC053367]|uniref:LuxR C-terminal-related transcriptional regulator n=1 Tax=Streptomyces sp. NPDC053367 TaxID=3365700 RepID=UPI0037D2FBCC